MTWFNAIVDRVKGSSNEMKVSLFLKTFAPNELEALDALSAQVGSSVAFYLATGLEFTDLRGGIAAVSKLSDQEIPALVASASKFISTPEKRTKVKNLIMPILARASPLVRSGASIFVAKMVETGVFPKHNYESFDDGLEFGILPLLYDLVDSKHQHHLVECSACGSVVARDQISESKNASSSSLYDEGGLLFGIDIDSV